ncbi:MAG: ABC transporter ATP-binding protein [Gammaproteobacteria bacterium]|nr:MAG: ABC transporter ATP-binding protein [Gammaproteobacteria bacterium]
MENSPAIQISDLSKCYQIYGKPHHRLLQAIFRNRRYYKEFWATRDISFTVEKGTTVGIVGQNGSGKSTLLQMIAGTLTPTSGQIITNGRVAALLELGAGFNPEFTGRENIFMNAAIVGISRAEIEELYDTIVSFAEIQDFIDKPVKTYSSGMYVRLAFAIAIHVSPDILIVDEALAVGDVRFQSKCFQKFKELQKEGVTILFVTHSTEMVVKHCQKAIFINDGAMVDQGDPKRIVHKYLDFIFSKNPEQQAKQHGTNGDSSTESDMDGGSVLVDRCTLRNSYNPGEYRWGDGRARIVDYRITCNNDAYPIVIPQFATVQIEMDVDFYEDVEDLIYGLTIKTVDGTTVYGSNTRDKEIAVSNAQAGTSAIARFSFTANIIGGDYFISLGVACKDEIKGNIPVDRRYDFIHIKVEDAQDSFGVAALDMDIDISQRDAPENRPDKGSPS